MKLVALQMLESRKVLDVSGVFCCLNIVEVFRSTTSCILRDLQSFRSEMEVSALSKLKHLHSPIMVSKFVIQQLLFVKTSHAASLGCQKEIFPCFIFVLVSMVAVF